MKSAYHYPLYDTDKHGGPAFPRPPVINLNDDSCAYESSHSDGMSLGDWYAGQALIGLLAGDAGKSDFQFLAARAHTSAEAMIGVREKRYGT